MYIKNKKCGTIIISDIDGVQNFTDPNFLVTEISNTSKQEIFRSGVNYLSISVYPEVLRAVHEN